MLQSLGNLLSGDSRAVPYLLALAIVVVILALLFALYRLVFAHRVRVPGTPRNRAPRLGIVDVYSLDGQRQLVIVRRDNVEHLLMIGGPNDLVVEPQIMRGAVNGANGREALKAVPPEPAPVEPPPAPLPRPVAPNPAPPRRAGMRGAAGMAEPSTTLDGAPTVVFPADPPPLAADPAPEPRLRPTPIRPEPRPLEAKFGESSRFAETARAAEAAKPAEARLPDFARGDAAGDTKPPEPLPVRRPVVTPRPLAAAPRPNLPSPITPLRPRNPPDASPKSAPAEAPPKPPEATIVPPVLITPEPAPAPIMETPVTPPPVLMAEAPTITEPPAVETTAPAVEAAPAPVVAEANHTAEAPRSRAEETFYDLESLEAEMARLLGREG